MYVTVICKLIWLINHKLIYKIRQSNKSSKLKWSVIYRILYMKNQTQAEINGCFQFTSFINEKSVY